MPKRRTFWSDPFFDMECIDELMDQFMNEALEQFKDKEGPMYYGFSVSIDPNGKPVVNEFGNIRPRQAGPVLNTEIEPLVDVIDSKGSVTVCAELPGVDKKDISLSVNADSLIISVEGAKRRYYKDVSLPVKVDPDTAKTNHTNGVLEVTLEKTASSSGKRIKVD
jgi:HSP20 family protein